MAVRYRVATAPCSWGVDFADRPGNPDWRRVLDEAAAAGFAAMDLGPLGYFPTDPARLADEFARCNLGLSAGGLFDPLTEEAAFPAIVDKTRRTCEILRALEAPRLVIIDRVSDARGDAAGRPAAAPRLDPSAWAAMMARVTGIARVAREDYGVFSYLHAHAGCWIEYEDELDRAMSDLPPELVGLCVDTGHAAYAGMDPVALIRRYGPRIGHVHLKDIDPDVHAACLAAGTDFFTAVGRNIFAPLGEGMVDFQGVREALATIGYAGLTVVEQDIDPAGDASALDNARASHRFLASIGMASGEKVPK